MDYVIIKNKDSGKPRGFGFVTYDNEDSVERVMETYHEICINGKWVNISYYLKFMV